MRSGSLRHSIEIMQSVDAQSETGAITKIWSLFAKVRADVRDVKAENRFQSQHFNSIVTKQLIVRWIDGLKAGMRFEHAGSKYQIEPPRDITGRRKMLEIMASEVIDG